MDKDLIIDVGQSEVSIALLENKRLIELNREKTEGRGYSVGDVYLGRVKKILPSLNAAFVDIGDEKDAFVHYLDLGLNFKAFDSFVRGINPNSDFTQLYRNTRINDILEKEGKIERFLSPGQPIAVQIVKEPISTKGSRLTAEISIAGRNLVLLPFADKVSISQKISSREEKKRLERLVYSILPPNYGVIIRTAAEGKRAAVLDAELKSLIKKWEDSWPKLAKNKGVQLLFTENSRTTTILRDLLNDSFTNIYVNDEAVYKEVDDYVTMISPEQEKIVKLYKGHEPILDHFEVSRQIKGSFGKIVSIKSGAYLVIEHTEALHVIDVNSGIRAKQKDQENNAFEVNKNAAEEIARQLRLRDMGGIVIIDFIDMDDSNHRLQLYKYMQDLMAGDRAKHTVLPLTKFGLMQITRQRVRPATEINTTEVCPTCNGTGKVGPTILFDEAVERQLAYYTKERGLRDFLLKVSPIFEAYLTRGFNSIRRKWCRKYSCKIKIVGDSDYSILQATWCRPDGEPVE
ncbi:MAG: Rne/Rng family ribonuclease [Bacteroidales bacterium]|jgi:ribonuclease G|nr:Rne/Rng family ribonuclease [Bacteroidales bacterium]